MACRIIRDNKGKLVDVLSANGQRSNLFSELVKLSNPEKALEIYSNVISMPKLNRIEIPVSIVNKSNVNQININSPKVNYELRAIEILQSQEAINIFKKGEKNNWSLEKILTEAQVPKIYIPLIINSGYTDREDIILDLYINYNQIIEINTSYKEVSPLYYDEVKKGTKFILNDKLYSYDPLLNEGFQFAINRSNKKKEYITEEEFKKALRQYYTEPTNYYSNLTVPGGTNYTENEIATPDITPSIKGHAQFSTNNGLMWSRTDEKVQYQEQDIDNLLKIMENNKILQIKCS